MVDDFRSKGVYTIHTYIYIYIYIFFKKKYTLEVVFTFKNVSHILVSDTEKSQHSLFFSNNRFQFSIGTPLVIVQLILVYLLGCNNSISQNYLIDISKKKFTKGSKNT